MTLRNKRQWTSAPFSSLGINTTLDGLFYKVTLIKSLAVDVYLIYADTLFVIECIVLL